MTKDVPPNTVVAGNPAKVIKTIEEYKEKISRIWEKQKPSGYALDLKDGVRYSPEYIYKVKKRDSYLLKEHLNRVLE